MAKLLPYVDVCIANEEDAKDVFGIEAENTDINSGKLDHEGYISVARQIAQRFGCKKVAITLRGSISATDNDCRDAVRRQDRFRRLFHDLPRPYR